MAKGRKVLVTERAVLRRVNRALAAKGQVLKKQRGRGTYVLVDTRRNVIAQEPASLEALARSLGALAAYEAMR